MSHDQGLPKASTHPHWDNETSSDAGRPSLFAGMEGHDEDDSDRIQILSALSPHPTPSKRAKGAGRLKPRKARVASSPWLQRSLYGLTALGLVALLVGFVMVLLQNQERHARVERIAALASAPAPAPLAAPKPTEVSPPNTAHIEELSPLTDVPAALTSVVAATVTAIPAPASSAPLVSAPSASKHEPNRATSKADHTKRSDARPKTRRNTAQGDADVALLEAMFAHGKGPHTTQKSEKRR